LFFSFFHCSFEEWKGREGNSFPPTFLEGGNSPSFGNLREGIIEARVSNWFSLFRQEGTE